MAVSSHLHLVVALAIVGYMEESGVLGQVPMKPSLIFERPRSGIIRSDGNTRVELLCYPPNVDNLTFSFMINGRTVTSQTAGITVYQSPLSALLTIYEFISTIHTGVYTCKATNETGASVSSDPLDVKFYNSPSTFYNLPSTPTVYPGPWNLKFLAGSTVKLQCNHIPFSILVWYKDGNVLRGENSTILRLENYEPSTMDGSYSCQVKLTDAWNGGVVVSSLLSAPKELNAVECIRKRDCADKGSKPQCDSITNTCVACTVDAHCNGSNEYCNKQDRVCACKPGYYVGEDGHCAECSDVASCGGSTGVV